MAHDPFDDNGLLPMGESDSSDDEAQAIWALLERRRKRRMDGLEATHRTRGEVKPVLWFIDDDGIKKRLTPEKTMWFLMFVAGQKHMDENDHKKFRMVFDKFENAIVLQQLIQWRDFVISRDVANLQFAAVFTFGTF